MFGAGRIEGHARAEELGPVAAAVRADLVGGVLEGCVEWQPHIGDRDGLLDGGLVRGLLAEQGGADDGEAP